MDDSPVLFCPFCRESFEGEKTCPEHELTLVSFDRLGPDPEDPELLPEVIDQQPVAMLALGYGRGWVLFGAVLNLLALPMTMVRGASASISLSYRRTDRVPRS